MNKQELLVKNKEKPSLKFGKDPYHRTLNELFERGVISIDKDAGPTSHQTVDYLKKVLKIDKAGHSGTLDPKVTGLLATGLGRGTRLMEYMLKSNKEYICLMYVHKPVTQQQIEDVLKKFTGKIMQLPPIISAIKRELREREIYYINLLDVKDEGQNVLFRVGCQHGTYIRKLCSDMGDYLEVGAQMKELRRTKAGPFKEENNMVSLDKLRNLYELYNSEKDEKTKEIYEKELRTYIKPYEEALSDFKKVIVRDNAVSSIAHGADLAIPGVAKLDDGIEIGEEIAMLTQRGELIAMGIAYLSSKNVMKKKKGAFIKTNKVFIEPDYYPEVWKFEKQEEEN
ncbi:MAG: RNA-guided pseudouridylation complex pseudouridine synthase subunit Cbf5 [Candidatus Woesearchaeota archaeon]|jgi:H/ACA ribonucleoprotein complex subunit 4|nr:RNA-guided pseudouridylation complex pseudouridine synthase subunit Cbf5 [Candidatus Woesearchaeota archaeon]